MVAKFLNFDDKHLSEVVKHRNVMREMSSMSEHISLVASQIARSIACSQTIYFLFRYHRAHE